MAKFLFRDASAWKKCGPANEFRPTVPNVPAAGRLQGPRVQPLAFSSEVGVVVSRQPVLLVPAGAVANHLVRLGFWRLASPAKMARQGPVSSSLPQLRYPGVNGRPDSQTQIPESCHPPMR